MRVEGFECPPKFEGHRATPAVALKKRSLLLIWVISLLLGVQFFGFNSNSSTQIWTPEPILESDKRDPLIIVSFFFLWTGHNWRIELVTVRYHACGGEERELEHVMEDGDCPIRSLRKKYECPTKYEV